MAKQEPKGRAQMWALASSLPDALLEGFRHGREIALPAESTPTTVYVVGMGGSGIAGELAKGVVEAETSVLFAPVRSPTPPRSLSSRSRVIAVSYSGNTWETLRAYEAAGQAGAYRMAITAGGALAQAAAKDRVPLLPVPAGLPPRSAVGYLMGGLFGVMDPWFPESNEDRLTRIAAKLRSTIAAYPRAGSAPAKLAAAIGDRLPFVYAESAFLGLARRWKTQIEENAKRLAVFDEIPELFHNSLVGWDAITKDEAEWRTVLLLDWAGSPPLVRQSIRYLERLLKTKQVPAVKVPLASDDRLEALLLGLTLGDHLSLVLADREGIDPLPVEAITRLKSGLGTLHGRGG